MPNDHTIDLKLIKAIKQKYGFNTIEMQSPIGGLSALNYSILTDKGLFVLKQYRSTAVGSVHHIESITELLASHKVPVVIPLPINSLELHFSYKNHLFAVYPKIEGFVLHEQSLTKHPLSSVAHALSQFHSVGRQNGLDLQTTADRIVPLDGIQDKARKLLDLVQSNSIDKETDELARQLAAIKLSIVSSLRITNEELDPLSQKDLVHGDFHNENLLFDKHQNVLCVLDFEEVHYGYASEDVLNFINFACCNSGYNEHTIRTARYFLKEYIALHHLSKQEIELGVRLMIYRLASSFFLETELYASREYFLKQFLVRDIGKFTYFKDNLSELVDELTRQ
jgi:Ser/Thr protein kinase RdoA (MazF antagonist)